MRTPCVRRKSYRRERGGARPTTCGGPSPPPVGGGERAYRSVGAAVLEAQPTLLALADDLEEVRGPHPRGVALALALLREGGGPLYRPCDPGEFRLAAEEARHAL